MRICVQCGAALGDETWTCAACGWAPPVVAGFLSFLDGAEPAEAGYDATFFAQLPPLEESHFWYRSRNRLIVWALARYFADARTLLEVGCGTGYVLAGLRSAFADLSLVGGELFLEGLRIARGRLDDVALYQLDATCLPFDGEFDVVCSFDVLEHLDDDAAALAEFYRATRPRGGLLLTVPQHQRLWSAADDAGRHRRRYARRDLEGKIRRAGFDVVHSTSFMTTVLPLVALSRFRTRRMNSYDPLAELRIPRTVNRVLEQLVKVDGAAIRRGASLPVGASLLVAARRR